MLRLNVSFCAALTLLNTSLAQQHFCFTHISGAATLLFYIHLWRSNTSVLHTSLAQQHYCFTHITGAATLLFYAHLWRSNTSVLHTSQAQQHFLFYTHSSAQQHFRFTHVGRLTKHIFRGATKWMVICLHFCSSKSVFYKSDLFRNCAVRYA